MKLEAIILAGGFGTRLQSIIKDVPKPMAPIGNIPFLFYLIKHLKQQGIRKIHLSLHYKPEQIEKAFEMEEGVTFFKEEVPLGTGGAILRNLDFINSEDVLIINGDTFNEIDILEMYQFHKQKQSKFTIGAINVLNTDRYGSLIIKEDLIIKFQEKAENNAAGFINSGLYIANKSYLKQSLSKINKTSFSIETEMLANNAELFAYKAQVYFIDIGVPEDYVKAQAEIPGRVKKKALFLDRDGVINHDAGYTHDISTLQFIEGIFDFVRMVVEEGYIPVIITNQSGISRNYYSLQDYYKIQNFIEAEFMKYGIIIAKTYFCPYHPEGTVSEFARVSEDRKPNPGMIFKARDELLLDLEKSVLVGDKRTDILAGQNAGIIFNFLFENNFQEILSKIKNLNEIKK